MEDFLLTGNINGKRLLGLSRSEIINILGDPDYTEEYHKGNGYYHYPYSLRIGFIDNIISNYGYVYKYLDEEEDFDSSKISKKMLLHEFLFLINNDLKVTWEINKSLSNDDYFVIKVNQCTLVYFDLYTGKVERIIFTKFE